MSISNRVRAFLHRIKGINFPPTSSLKPFPFSQHRFCSNISNPHSFAESYLIHNLGFSPESASKLCSNDNFRFTTAEKSNSVLTFFRDHGFSDSQLHNMIAKIPWLLSCDPSKRVLPKFQFFLSKGISNSDIVNLVSMYPCVLSPSLENQTVPTYDLLCRFVKSNKKIIALLAYHQNLFSNRRMEMEPIIRMLIEIGMKDACIARLILQFRWSIFNIPKGTLLKVAEGLKDLGFHPSKSNFAIALTAKLYASKTGWDEKVDTFKKWGWSDEDILKAFRSYPHCMLTSVDKLNSVMSFWVNHLDWDALALVKRPHVISLSLERTIIPRATVLQFLINKGLRKKNASLLTPFKLPEKLFVDKFIKYYKEDSSELLMLYQEKLNLAYTNNREKNTGGIS